jgi:hypothetical protein
MNTTVDINEITKRHLSFLSSEYGFKYDEKTNSFDNGVVRFRIEQLDSLEPSIEVWFKSEPKFTRIDLSWIIDEYVDYKTIDKYLFEDRLAYYAKLMREHAQELFSEPEFVTLNGLKKRFISELKTNKTITEHNYFKLIPPDLVKYFHYIKKKDRMWNPGKELP